MTSSDVMRGAIPVAVVAPLLLIVTLVTGCAADPSDGPGSTRSPSPTPSSASPDRPQPTTSDPSDPTPAPDRVPTALGSKWDWSRFAEFEPYLRSLPEAPTFYEAVWCDVEPTQGELDWDRLDRVVDRSSEVGATLMLKIRVGRCWATSGEAEFTRGVRVKTESAMPEDLDQYRDFVTALVSRYAARGVHRYAIENEINSASFWAGSPEDYAELAAVAAETIRAADPAAEVVDAGLGSTTYGYGMAQALLDDGDVAGSIEVWNAYYERRIGTRGETIPFVDDVDILERVLGSQQGRRNLDYLAVVSSLADQGVVDVRQVHFYEKWSVVPQLFDYLRSSTPADTPIEFWEVGIFDRGSGLGEDESAWEVVKAVSLLVGEGAGVVVWLPLAFDPGGRNPDEPRFGLLDPDGTARPAGLAYQAIASAARDASPVPIATDDLQGVGFDGGQGSTALVWAADSTPVELAGPARAVPLTGPESGPGGVEGVLVDEEPRRILLDVTIEQFLEAQE